MRSEHAQEYGASQLAMRRAESGIVPKTDADGNDVAGIRLPEIAVPVATYSGWNVRAADYPGDDLCHASGQKISFAETKAGRIAKGDPRLSIDERYPTHSLYVAKVSVAAAKLAR